MKSSIALACALFAAMTAAAQVNYYRAQQQAIRANVQNNQEQQNIQREANASPNDKVVDPALQATLNNINSLQADFAAAAKTADAKTDATQKVSLLNNLTQAAQGTKAASASVRKLADDLLTAMAGKAKLTVPLQTKLAREVHAMFNSGHLTAAQQDKIVADVQKTLTDAGASSDDASNVINDLKAVATETK